jgi:hypothetical protein
MVGIDQGVEDLFGLSLVRQLPVKQERLSREAEKSLPQRQGEMSPYILYDIPQCNETLS